MEKDGTASSHFGRRDDLNPNRAGRRERAQGTYRDSGTMDRTLLAGWIFGRANSDLASKSSRLGDPPRCRGNLTERPWFASKGALGCQSRLG